MTAVYESVMLVPSPECFKINNWYISARSYFGCTEIIIQNFSLSVESQDISQASEANKWNFNFFQHKIPNHFTEIVVYCERRDLLCSHSNSDISRVKTTCYFLTWRYHVFVCAKAQLVFHWCLYNRD